MAASQTADNPAVVLPTGTWRVDPSDGELTFRSRGMFGLVAVRGTFGGYAGELEADADGARGELRIEAATLDTGNQKRDVHLRSADFFDVDAHPTVTFSLTRLSAGSNGAATFSGLLRVRDNELRIDGPVDVVRLADDRVRLHAQVSVDRTAAGLGWSKMGMVQGKAHLGVVVTLVRG
jgi:polyisoprenoid-binding protein YceI